MPDSKITALTSISTSTDPANDPLVIVDVSDTSMAATGTTKKVTLNQLLGASGTATLASATITGDLTVDTNVLKVDTTNNVVGIGTATPNDWGAKFVSLRSTTGISYTGVWNDGVNSPRLEIGHTSTGSYLNASSASGGSYSRLRFQVAGADQYQIDTSGVFTWYDGAGGTRMTLNSTGLGVGVSPAFKLDIAGSIQSTSDVRIKKTGSDTFASGPFVYLNSGDGSGNGSALQLNASNGLDIWNSTGGTWSRRLTVDSSGNVGIGVTPSAWNSNYNALDIGQNGTISGRVGSSNTVDLASNGFRNTSGNWVYKLATSNTACRYQLDGSTGSHIWYSGAAGTAGNTIAGFSSALMTLDASGNLILQPPSSPPTLGTNGQLTVNATSNTNLRFSYRGSDGVTRVANITLA